MKLRSIILIALILIIPLVALTWAMTRIADNEQIAVEQNFRELLEGRLHDVNGNITSFFESTEREVDKITALDKFDIAGLRKVNRSEPRLMQLFVMDSRGELLYPDITETDSSMMATERRFAEEASKMFGGQDLHEFIKRSELENSEIDANESGIASSGWFVWYWDRGVNLIYWQRRPSGHIVGCALERARWISDLIGELPDTVENTDENSDRLTRGIETRVRLVNASGEAVYQWGSYEPPPKASAFCEVPVVAPLSSWRLICYVPEEELTSGTGKSAKFGLFGILAAIGGLILICGLLLVREYARDMREASQQVSFVNQVSHELRTPLTNIRLYAELLDRDLDGVSETEAAKPRERLNVILSEGQRLSRLIGNVLTFARQKRKTLQLQTSEQHPCKLVESIIGRFRPAFERQQIDITIACDFDGTLHIDADVLEQILGNLLSNVEKYAASGGQATVACSVDADLLTIDVRDSGPGIEKSKRNLVFEPFQRISNDVSHVAGTGIGLPIARELARLHGGDLRLMDSDAGCWFRATIRSTNSRSTSNGIAK